ncbi:hypothetical protein LY76DRAFT_405524 [Colletotrichum caudatum]|nr:hypothetical protein LY76DRAFT_405524 [Colletotrichum caudatum]
MSKACLLNCAYQPSYKPPRIPSPWLWAWNPTDWDACRGWGTLGFFNHQVSPEQPCQTMEAKVTDKGFVDPALAEREEYPYPPPPLPWLGQSDLTLVSALLLDTPMLCIADLRGLQAVEHVRMARPMAILRTATADLQRFRPCNGGLVKGELQP